MSSDNVGSPNGGSASTFAEKHRQRTEKLRQDKDSRRANEIDKMTNERLERELKAKGIPTFGTRQERAARLKVACGLPASSDADEKKPGKAKKGGVVEEIERLRQQREQRRRKMEEDRKTKEDEKSHNEAMGLPGDVDFQRMVTQFRTDSKSGKALSPIMGQGAGGKGSSQAVGIWVCVRKRPLNDKEVGRREIDTVTVVNPKCHVHECKFKVDGITKFLENHHFAFDRTFTDSTPTQSLHECCSRPLVDFALRGGGRRATIFAYGQTGSGKTYTMRGMQSLLCSDLYDGLEGNPHKDDLDVSVSFFEIYGGRVYDLLNNRQRLQVLEDAKQEVQVQGLCERPAKNAKDLHDIIEYGHSVRTTKATSTNADSSRSHAVCCIALKLPRTTPLPSPPERKQLVPQPPPDKFTVYSKLTLVDLAGSERAQDTRHHNRARRVEAAEINRSLLALKECIRALAVESSSGPPASQAGASPWASPSGAGGGAGGGSGSHIPFRASKLTMVLRECFVCSASRTLMIACVSPGMASADHTLNTLRYAARLKETPDSPQPAGVAGSSPRPPQSAPASPAVHQPPEPTEAGGPGFRLPPRAKSKAAVAPSSPPAPRPPPPSHPVRDADRVPLSPIPPPRGSKRAAGGAASPPPPAPGPAPIPHAASSPAPSSSTHAPGSKSPPEPSASSGVPEAESDASPNEGEEETEAEGEGEPEDGRHLARVSRADMDFLKESLTKQGMGEALAITDSEYLETVEDLYEWEDRITRTHMSTMKEDANMLTMEGELMKKFQDDDGYELEDYVEDIEKIVERKVHLYKGLLKTISKVKTIMQQEETSYKKAEQRDNK
ncbi:unnamed protein product [Vitrella brassicaformis CCMP3155]|uniref:Kinesin-like protein n=2 Tax=Vitrella brassicaformis TaxID=1169539 RepID=A0A0G4ELP0_VITBC|nr:unnamed protein product [Vitrella brassicaformis CCMP3155]|eukprot:CEL97887.1 unnamed protein product [Vitrella brassicaformis CCMP3155]